MPLEITPSEFLGKIEDRLRLLPGLSHPLASRVATGVKASEARILPNALFLAVVRAA